VPDVLPPPGAPFHVLFCGINPGLYSAATGWHFARPGNRFWAALHGAGFTPRRLEPSEQDLLAGYGLGITNLAPRATAQASELSPAELRRHRGRDRLPAILRYEKGSDWPAGRNHRRGAVVDRAQSQRAERTLAAAGDHRGIPAAARRGHKRHTMTLTSL
jgi:Uracil DNA glycosylase superfamily